MSPYQVVKVSDEGSGSPFMARIFMGLLELRDQLFLLGVPDEEKDQLRDYFVSKFEPMLDAAQATRDSALEIKALVAAHIDEIQSGQAVRFRLNQYEILHTIDNKFSQSVDKLLDQSIVATKTGLQSILRDPLGLEIGFFFQRDPQFSAGIAALRAAGEHSLAQYLEDVRLGWHSVLQDLRSQHEHHGWSLDRVNYHLIGPSQVAVNLPSIVGSPVDVFTRCTANRVLLFIENMMVFAMRRNCQFPIFVVEIPEDQRDPVNPQRFRIAPRGLDSSTPWQIAYTDDMDFV